MSEKLTKIPVTLLTYSGRNPRHEMRGLEELAKNIAQYGVLQPILVRPKGDKFEVVVGERRARAAIIAGLDEVPAIIRDVSDREADELRLIENIQRDDLTDAEKGDAVYALIESYPEKYRSIADVARALNKPYHTIRMWATKSRKLSSRVRELITRNQLTEVTSLYLMKYDHETQSKLGETIAKHRLNQEQAINFIKRYGANPEIDLDTLAEEVKGVKRVRIDLEELPPEVRKEVERVIEEKKERVRKVRREAIRKAHKAPRKPKPKPIQVKLPTPQVEVPKPRPPAEVKPKLEPKPIEEGLKELLEKNVQKLKEEPFTIREAALKRLRKVLEEPVPAKKERKMIKEVDTGIIITQECPICHRTLKYRLIHCDPSNTHKLVEVKD